MKTTYIHPMISVTPVSPLSILMASGGPKASSNLDVKSDGKSGNVADAF